MAVTGLTIYQDNVGAEEAIFAIHSPLVFLVDATYTGTAPDFIYCDILTDGISLLVVRCIYVDDIDASTRRFKLVADEILRSLMDDFDDFEQTGQSTVIVPNISKVFNLVFEDDLIGTVQVNIEMEALHAVRQIGESSNLSTLKTNTSEIYIGGVNKPVYIYFYATELPDSNDIALDYNDDFFVDYNDDYFTIE